MSNNTTPPPRHPSPSALLKAYRQSVSPEVHQAVSLFNLMDARDKMELLLYMILNTQEQTQAVMRNTLLLAQGLDRVVADITALQNSTTKAEN